MAEPDPKEALKLYGRHQRAQRWARRMAAASKVGAWCLGLSVTTASVYGGYVFYEDHTRLAELYRRGSGKSVFLSVPPEAVVVAQPPSHDSPPKDIWSGDGWKREAQLYIDHTLTTTISSANPPRHRHAQ